MKAIVKYANRARGMYAAQIEEFGEYSIFELIDTREPEIGDIISCSDFFYLGGGPIKNITQQCWHDVILQDVCGDCLVRQKLML